jgi:hypothetical protein
MTPLPSSLDEWAALMALTAGVLAWGYFMEGPNT